MAKKFTRLQTDDLKKLTVFFVETAIDEDALVRPLPWQDTELPLSPTQQAQMQAIIDQALGKLKADITAAKVAPKAIEAPKA